MPRPSPWDEKLRLLRDARSADQPAMSNANARLADPALANRGRPGVSPKNPRCFSFGDNVRAAVTRQQHDQLTRAG